MIAWLTSRERWLPAITAAAWWVTFYPGFFGEDGLQNLADARSRNVTVGFTAWWMFILDAVTLNTRAIPLVTLLCVVGLSYATYFWMITVFPRGRARAIAVLVICATPLVGAIGIQGRNDAAMTAGLLIAAAVLARTWSSDRLSRADVVLLMAVPPLIATRHNGMPTIVAAAIGCALAKRWRHAGALGAVAIATTTITFMATRAAGAPSSIDPVLAVEWMSLDISCVLSMPGVEPAPAEWLTLEKIAARDDWPQRRACFGLREATRPFSVAGVQENRAQLIGVGRSLAARYPAKMTLAHARRVRLFLPPLISGMPDSFIVPFLHSTIWTNDLGLRWAWPGVAERARVVVRAWNAGGYLIANTAVWLIVLALVAWRRSDLRPALIPALIIGVCMNLGLVAVAPVSEGRYGVFILICGQAAGLFAIVSRWQGRRA